MSVSSQHFYRKSLLTLAISGSVVLLSACGSDSETSGSEVNGNVFASYVNGAAIVVTDSEGNEVAGPVNTDEMGDFSVRIPNAYLGEALVFTATGGQYDDEASGESTVNTSLSAYISADTLSGGTSTQFSIGPQTTIIERLVSEYGLDLETAQSRFEQAFGYAHDLSTIPVDATEANGEAEEGQKLAGLRAAVFSQLIKDLGLPAGSHTALLNLLADDLSDGNFDGLLDGSDTLGIDDVSLATDIQNKISQALVNFRGAVDSSGNALDATSLSNAQLGILPFSKIAMSESYIVTFVPESMSIKHGKSSFQLQITNKQGEPESGLNPMLMPMMHMAMHNHSTPSLMISESDVPGTYDATIYYVMASKMGSGESMGYWDLKVQIGEESVHFYPTVNMAMGDTVHARLKGQDDSIANMSGEATKRPYELFREDMSSDDDGTDFSVFIATRENMMSFPALKTGSILNQDSDYELTINSISVQMSGDGSTWTDASTEGNGIWSAEDLTVAEVDDTQTIHVRLSVNGEQKTDDGSAPDGVGDEAMFIINSSAMDMVMGM